MNELKTLFEQAREGTLPPDFDQWDIANVAGCAVAHVQAIHGLAHWGFDRWDMSDKYGWSVAHTAAWHRKLPKDFDRLELWDLADDDGITVRDVYNGNDDAGRRLKFS